MARLGSHAPPHHTLPAFLNHNGGILPVFKFLMNWYFPIEELKDLMLKVESISKTASKLEIEDIIIKWMDENPSIKRDWLRGIR